MLISALRTATTALGLVLLAAGPAGADGPDFASSILFPEEDKHNHASCVIETAPGRLLATWYSGGGERKSDDVAVQGAWLEPGRAGWGPRFVMADTPGYPDCNPALFPSPTGEVWLFWPTILDHRWEGALLKFQVSGPSPPTGPISWSRSGVLHVTPASDEFAAVVQRAMDLLTPQEKESYREELAPFAARSRDLLYQRLGWMPRVRAIELRRDGASGHPGRWILPLYCDTFSLSLMAISDDGGKTWKAGRPMAGFGNIQPSLVEKKDGTLVAFMRDNGPHHRIRVSTSADAGETWGPVVDSSFPNPGAGIEAARLRDGCWALIYNDADRGRHTLAVSLSDDEGASWKWTRHLERREPGAGQYHYPSMFQGSDGNLHATYTYRDKGKGSTIKYARFDEAWIRQGDPASGGR
ncbi:Sialidase precursor [Aquisphaera giovannonii]|uniref:Sialidase n=1 Tax=Aquisphaera giovannonii TaxID=406548 RepID=A0A5B9W9R1_9BACT|nr:exo-alpha-sialidase [Aquisphaera giovannonii]QEH36821.1 Sialidase precursor [Aquisphaera giovannonii]